MIAQIRELTIQYGKRTAVDALDVELAAGEIALLLGPNGAGKSTLLAAVAGAVLPVKGSVVVDGQDLATAPRSARAMVGFADQPPQLYDFFTVEEHVGFVAEARGVRIEAVERLVEQHELDRTDERGRETDALAHAERQLATRPLRDRGEPELVEDVT